MSRHTLQVVGGILLTGLLLTGADAFGQKDKDKPKEPLWTHAFDLSVRQGGESDWKAKTTKAFGFEVFRDQNNGHGIYINQEGGIAITPDALAKPLDEKGEKPVHLHGLDLKVRKVGEKDFDEKTQVFGVEVFRDTNTGNLVYLTQKGGFAVVAGKGGLVPTEEPKPPRWTHGFDLKVRPAGEKKFDDAKIYSVEVFRDENTGLLVYICETGSIALGTGDAPMPKGKNKGSEWLHGLDLKCRKGGNLQFDDKKKVKVYGAEVFRDENNGNLIYISETGALAVVPGGKDLAAPTPEEKLRDPAWRHGLDLKCRKVGEDAFSDKTRIFGLEVFRDENTGSLLYISEVGFLGALPGKK
jgi:hypothetical protein